MSSVSVFAYVEPLPEHVDAVRRAAAGIVEDVMAEPGCHGYHLLERAEGGSRRIAWFERWADEAAFQAHLDGVPAASLGAALEGRLAGAMVVEMYRDVEGGR